MFALILLSLSLWFILEFDLLLLILLLPLILKIREWFVKKVTTKSNSTFIDEETTFKKRTFRPPIPPPKCLNSVK